MKTNTKTCLFHSFVSYVLIYKRRCIHGNPYCSKESKLTRRINKKRRKLWGVQMEKHTIPSVHIFLLPSTDSEFWHFLIFLLLLLTSSWRRRTLSTQEVKATPNKIRGITGAAEMLNRNRNSEHKSSQPAQHHNNNKCVNFFWKKLCMRRVMRWWWPWPKWQYGRFHLPWINFLLISFFLSTYVVNELMQFYTLKLWFEGDVWLDLLQNWLQKNHALLPVLCCFLWCVVWSAAY